MVEVDFDRSRFSDSIRLNHPGFAVHRKPLTDYSSLSSNLDDSYSNDPHITLLSSNHHAPTELQTERPNQTAREYKHTKQLFRLLAVGLVRFLITGALIGSLIGTVMFYKRKNVMDLRIDKKLFNFYTTGLSMLLGISIASSFKQVALDIRWRLLSRKKRSLEHVDGILHMDSLTNLLFMAASRLRKGKFGSMIGPFIWIVVNLAAQAAVAMLALTYSLNPTTVSTPSSSGDVRVADLSTFYAHNANTNLSDPYFIMANQLAAHMYGENTLSYVLGTTASLDATVNAVPPNIPYTSEPADYFAGPNYTQYIFQQWSLSGESPIGQFYTNRSIYSTSQCSTYVVTQGANGRVNNIGYDNSAGVFVTRSFKLVQPQSTTFYTNPMAEDCGPRCANVCAFENNGNNGFYHECTITLSNVTNAYDPVHHVSDAQARTAAAAIALQGYYQIDGNYQINLTASYQRYPRDFKFGNWVNGNTTLMEETMRQFAIGTIVSADQRNSLINRTLIGSTPTQGLALKIEHPERFYAILLAIAAVQLILFIGGAFWANRVVVLDESHLAVALLLAPLVKGLEGGSLLNGSEIDEVLGEKNVVYGETADAEKGIRRIKLAEDGLRREFPEGWYD